MATRPTPYNTSTTPQRVLSLAANTIAFTASIDTSNLITRYSLLAIFTLPEPGPSTIPAQTMATQGLLRRMNMRQRVRAARERTTRIRQPFATPGSRRVSVGVGERFSLDLRQRTVAVVASPWRS